ncbi:MAG: VWA domain-containing protein [Candidatus Cloacimonetes bacterium]|nr:VWA domain-containing protein [Candidatus Cloacimonadota bacterium]
MFNFARPLYLFLLIIVPLVIWFDIFFMRKFSPKIKFSNIALLKQIQKRNSLTAYLPILIKSILLILFILSLAGPRLSIEKKEHTTHGIDIVMCMDVSGSMKAVDYQPVNRMEASKKVALDFIKKRENDRIGIVSFATYAYTLSPLTTDFNVLHTVVSNMKVDEEQSGTAIGNGLAISTLRLKDSPAKSKVIILLTDGENNAGEIDPVSAAEIAKLYDIKIYPIAVASQGPVDFPVQHPIYGTQFVKHIFNIDIDMLNKLADLTGTGKAATAFNTEQLNNILEEINRLETTEIKANFYYEHKELFVYFLWIALFLLVIMILFKTVFRIVLP